MKASRFLFAAISLIGIGSLSYAIGMRLTPVAHPHPLSAKAPVLVELFTSEGCSSCPPADALLAKLQRDAYIVPLSEHVDYWNSSAWKDRFSSAQFDERQAAYVKSLHAQSSYTPQMVVDGRAEFVGSDDDAAANAIAVAEEKPKANVSIETQAASGDKFSVEISIDHLPPNTSHEASDVYLAVTENNLSSSVEGGENGGRTLRHVAIVRKMIDVGAFEGIAFSERTTLRLNPSWKKSDLSVVAFVQQRTSGRIIGVGLAKL